MCMARLRQEVMIHMRYVCIKLLICLLEGIRRTTKEPYACRMMLSWLPKENHKHFLTIIGKSMHKFQTKIVLKY